MTTTAQRLSVVIATLMTVASAGGLLLPDLYRDNQLVASTWRGNDLVTLVVAVPVLAIALVGARRGSARASLVWLGMLDYALYNYAFYLFGAALNQFFLIYVGIFTLSILALVFGLAGVDLSRTARPLPGRARANAVAGFLLLVALGLGALHVAVAIGHLMTGEIPGMVAAVGHPTNVIAALDLSLVVPVSALAAVWLWQRQPWGVVLGVIAAVKGAIYMLALSAATLVAVRSGASSDLAQLWLWGPIGLGSAVSAWALLRR